KKAVHLRRIGIRVHDGCRSKLNGDVRLERHTKNARPHRDESNREIASMFIVLIMFRWNSNSHRKCRLNRGMRPELKSMRIANRSKSVIVEMRMTPDWV